MDKAIEKVEFLVGREIEVGKTYKGIVSSIKEYGAFVEFNGGQQGLLHISELTHDPVSKVSDVVSVGQVLSLTCIGQDVRGNIKLSLKATLPPPRNKKTLESKDTNSLPSQGIIGWAAVENLPSMYADGEASSSKHDDGMPEDAPAFSTPAVVIRSADECESQDVANSQMKAAKSSPRPYKSASRRVRTATPKKASGASTPKKLEKVKADDSGSDGLENSVSVAPDQEGSNSQDLQYSSPMNFQSGSIKLGDVVTAKVYQVRAYGLVLELSDGARGMHKFEASGEDFEVGEELLVKCESFNAKGIPVFSLLD